ncbi:hypothetical protein C8R43DRAFT_1013093 [Mycena crocata]|nr:hypothetical protein C8R43DRAFT_1013093 [Mycena crocata]
MLVLSNRPRAADISSLPAAAFSTRSEHVAAAFSSQDRRDYSAQRARISLRRSAVAVGVNDALESVSTGIDSTSACRESVPARTSAAATNLAASTQTRRLAPSPPRRSTCTACPRLQPNGRGCAGTDGVLLGFTRERGAVGGEFRANSSARAWWGAGGFGLGAPQVTRLLGRTRCTAHSTRWCRIRAAGAGAPSARAVFRVGVLQVRARGDELRRRVLWCGSVHV